MKLSILSESPADEAAVRILVEGIFAQNIEWIQSAKMRTRGWPAVIESLSVQLRYLHYRTDAEGLIVVIDSDDSPLHQPEHDGNAEPACRMCQINSRIAMIRQELPPRHSGSMLRVAIALAVPAIEAWYRCGHDPHAAEFPAGRAIAAGEKLYVRRNQLKLEVYGTTRPGLTLELRRAMEEANRLAADIARLEQQFPIGFGLFAQQIRSWL